MNFLQEFIKATKVLIGILCVMFFIHWLFGFGFSSESVKGILITNTLFSYSFYFGNVLLTYILDKWMPWNPEPKTRAIYGTIITLVVNLILTLTVVTMVSVFAYGGPSNYIFTADGKQTVFIAFVIIIVITLLFYSVGFFKEVQDGKLVNEKLRKEKMAAELNALKSQINPHFLFNSFNVLSGLIDENPNQAQKFLSGLSKIYRYVLENRDEVLVSLEQELRFAKQYLDLQKIRFENSIYLDLNVDDSSLVKQLPALSLQLLLENAINHNGFDSHKPLNISIESILNTLVVSNNKQERKKLSTGNGLGLANIKKRYDLQNVDGFIVKDTDLNFIVHLPLIQ